MKAQKLARAVPAPAKVALSQNGYGTLVLFQPGPRPVMALGPLWPLASYTKTVKA